MSTASLKRTDQDRGFAASPQTKPRWTRTSSYRRLASKSIACQHSSGIRARRNKTVMFSPSFAHRASSQEAASPPDRRGTTPWDRSKGLPPRPTEIDDYADWTDRARATSPNPNPSLGLGLNRCMSPAPFVSEPFSPSIPQHPPPTTAAAKHAKVKVQVLLSSPLFEAGSAISGRVELAASTNHRLKLGEIAVELEGTEELTSRDHAATQVFTYSRTLFQGQRLPPSNAVVPLQPVQGYWAARKGKTTFPFTFPLDAVMPSSVTFAGNAALRYTIKATVQVWYQDLRSVVSARQEAQVIERWEDQGAPMYWKPAEALCEGKLFMGGSSGVWLETFLDQRLFMAGGQAMVKMCIRNSSARSISGIRFDILRCLAFPVGEAGGPVLSETIHTQHYRGHAFEFLPGSEQTIVLPADIPHEARTIRKTVLFEVSLYIVVTLNMGTFAKDLEVRMPIFVAHPASLEHHPVLPPDGAQNPWDRQWQWQGQGQDTVHAPLSPSGPEHRPLIAAPPRSHSAMGHHGLHATMGDYGVQTHPSDDVLPPRPASAMAGSAFLSAANRVPSGGPVSTPGVAGGSVVPSRAEPHNSTIEILASVPHPAILADPQPAQTVTVTREHHPVSSSPHFIRNVTLPDDQPPHQPYTLYSPGARLSSISESAESLRVVQAVRSPSQESPASKRRVTPADVKVLEEAADEVGPVVAVPVVGKAERGDQHEVVEDLRGEKQEGMPLTSPALSPTPRRTIAQSLTLRPAPATPPKENAVSPTPVAKASIPNLLPGFSTTQGAALSALERRLSRRHSAKGARASVELCREARQALGLTTVDADAAEGTEKVHKKRNSVQQNAPPTSEAMTHKDATDCAIKPVKSCQVRPDREVRVPAAGEGAGKVRQPRPRPKTEPQPQPQPETKPMTKPVSPPKIESTPRAAPKETSIDLPRTPLALKASSVSVSASNGNAPTSDATSASLNLVKQPAKTQEDLPRLPTRMTAMAYEVGSARGGRGGRVASAASLWTSIANGTDGRSPAAGEVESAGGEDEAKTVSSVEAKLIKTTTTTMTTPTRTSVAAKPMPMPKPKTASAVPSSFAFGPKSPLRATPAPRQSSPLASSNKEEEDKKVVEEPASSSSDSTSAHTGTSTAVSAAAPALAGATRRTAAPFLNTTSPRVHLSPGKAGGQGGLKAPLVLALARGEGGGDGGPQGLGKGLPMSGRGTTKPVGRERMRELRGMWGT